MARDEPENVSPAHFRSLTPASRPAVPKTSRRYVLRLIPMQLRHVQSRSWLNGVRSFAESLQGFTNYARGFPVEHSSTHRHECNCELFAVWLLIILVEGNIEELLALLAVHVIDC